MTERNFTRQELYDLIWSKPLAQIANLLDTSMPVLRNLCFDQQIPVPDRGYWSRKGWGDWKPTPLTIIDNPPIINLPVALHAAQSNLLFAGEATVGFHVPTTLDDPDVLVNTAQKSITEDTYLYGLKGMLSTGINQVPVRASKVNMDRALRVIDTLIKAWRSRGYHVSVENSELIVNVRRVRQKITIREITKKLPKKDEFELTQYETTGQLALKVDGWPDREWKDGKSLLEDHLLDILNHMEMGARDLEDFWAKNAAKQKQEEARKQLEEAAIKSNEAEQSAFESLVKEAERWQQLRILKEYLDELNKITPHTPAFMEWYNWARHRMQVFNPINQRAENKDNV